METMLDLVAEARSRGRSPRVLMTRLRYLGDVILTTPAIADLKARYPEAEIHYCTERAYAEILEGNRSLSGIIPLDRGARGMIEAVAELRRMRFVAAVDFFYNPRSAWLLALGGIPIRVGGSRRARRRLYTHTFSVPSEARSAILHHEAALALFGVRPGSALPRIFLGADEEKAGFALLERTVGISRGALPIIAFHPGGTWPAKRWRPEAFAALARLLHERMEARVCAITGPGEEDIVRRVRAGAPEAVSILPPAALRTVASVIASCDAAVANDGGIMHMAVALGRPTVGVFGPTEPDIWFPYEGKGPYAVVTHALACAPCHRHSCEHVECLADIAPEEVFARLEGVLSWRN
jgi:lipopolysaccharide heptosyltransferase II